MVTNTDWYFVTHRLPHAIAALEAGMEVHVATPDTGWANQVRSAGVEFHPIAMDRGAPTTGRDLKSLVELVRLVQRVRPDVVHLIAARAVVLGGIAAWTRPSANIVYAITGQGYLPAVSGRLGLGESAYRWMLNLVLHRRRSWTIFQTTHDRDEYVRGGLIDARRAALIPGVGVDPASWEYLRAEIEPATILFAGRLIREKGLHDLVSAVRLLRRRWPDLRVLVAGAAEADLPTAVTRLELDAWTRDGLVEYLGHLEDIRPILRRSSVLVLPSYHREGVPKILLEGAASGVPVVATDIPGCSDVVHHEETGLLVPPRSPEEIAAAIDRVLSDGPLRDRLRHNARRMVEQHFTIEESARTTLRLYATSPEDAATPRRYESPRVSS